VSVSVVGSDAPASSVTIADIVTANGVVHVIDRVLLPTALALPSSLSIANNLGRVPELSRLATIVGSDTAYGDVVTALDSGAADAWTLFAPSDAAFAAFEVDGVNCATGDAAMKALCKGTFFYHAVGTKIEAGDIADGTTLVKSAATSSSAPDLVNLGDDGQVLKVVKSGGGVTVNGVNVVTTDIACGNGVIHIIDSVIGFPDSLGAIAGASPDLNSLVAALGATDLLETVDTTAGVTVFAPVDSAFAAIESETSRLNTEELSSVLTAHVVSPSVIYAQDVPGGDGATVTTLNAAVELNAVSSDSVSVSVVGSDAPASSVTIADIVTANGVVHVIDRVLLPTALALPSSLSIANNLGRVPELSRLATIVGSDTAYGDVVTALDSGAADAWTLFAPSDAAFAAFEVDGVNCATGDAAMKALCKGTFFYHAVGTKIEAGDIADGTTLVKSAATSSSAPDLVNLGDDGQVLKVVKSGGGVTVNGVNVVTTDIACGNGVIHIIDSVIGLPDSLAATAASNTDLSTLATVLENTDLLDTVDTTASITVFAPTDAAFSVLASEDQDTYDACVSENDIELAACGNILKYHVVPGAVKFASDILAEAPLTLETLAVSDDESSSVKVTVEGGEVIISDKAGNEAKVTDADVVVRNGVVHIIDSVLLLDSASVAQVSGALVALIAVVSAILV